MIKKTKHFSFFKYLATMSFLFKNTGDSVMWALCNNHGSVILDVKTMVELSV